jgi:hypothetical protein
MKNFRYISFAFALTLFISLLASSCKQPDQVEASLNDVQFAIPEKLEVPYGSEAITFRVQFGKKPSEGDRIAFGQLPDCPIFHIGESSFKVDISSLWDIPLSSGTYTVAIKRGSQSQKRGEMQIVVSAAEGDELQPAFGSTVYGKVMCAGEGVPDVAVSDGFEVVRTDKDGVYQLPSKKYHKYVFISVPSGYEPPRQGILPAIHAQLTKAASSPERVDFQLRKAPDQTDHTMLFIGDIHLANRTNDRNQFKDFVNDINAYSLSLGGPVYGLTLGDMTWDLYWETNSYGYKDYLADAKAIQGLTVYQTIGNHDHSMYLAGDFDTVAEYKQTVAPTYYSFNVGSVHYVVLDDVECTNSERTTDGNGKACYVRTYDSNLVQEQLEWLAKDLSLVSKTSAVVVAMHIPLYNDSGTYRWYDKSKPQLKEHAQALENILKQYPEAHVFTAHTHTLYNVDKRSSNKIYEHNSGSVCGTWWWSASETPGVHIGQDGSPGGYMAVSVKGGSLSWQFKATGSPLDYQFRTYDRNSIHITADKYVPDADASHKAEFKPGIWGTASSANEVYVNVWDYDPSWTVSVTEGGKSLSVARVTAPDPLHLVAYTAKRLNKNKAASFATTDNSHMFKVTASSASSTLEIKVTDAFGNTYTETMARPKAFNTDIYNH